MNLKPVKMVIKKITEHKVKLKWLSLSLSHFLLFSSSFSPTLLGCTWAELDKLVHELFLLSHSHSSSLYHRPDFPIHPSHLNRDTNVCLVCLLSLSLPLSLSLSFSLSLTHHTPTRTHWTVNIRETETVRFWSLGARRGRWRRLLLSGVRIFSVHRGECSLVRFKSTEESEERGGGDSKAHKEHKNKRKGSFVNVHNCNCTNEDIIHSPDGQLGGFCVTMRPHWSYSRVKEETEAR